MLHFYRGHLYSHFFVSKRQLTSTVRQVWLPCHAGLARTEAHRFCTSQFQTRASRTTCGRSASGEMSSSIRASDTVLTPDNFSTIGQSNTDIALLQKRISEEYLTTDVCRNHLSISETFRFSATVMHPEVVVAHDCDSLMAVHDTIGGTFRTDDSSQTMFERATTSQTMFEKRMNDCVWDSGLDQQHCDSGIHSLKLGSICEVWDGALRSCEAPLQAHLSGNQRVQKKKTEVAVLHECDSINKFLRSCSTETNSHSNMEGTSAELQELLGVRDDDSLSRPTAGCRESVTKWLNCNRQSRPTTSTVFNVFDGLDVMKDTREDKNEEEDESTHGEVRRRLGYRCNKIGNSGKKKRGSSSREAFKFKGKWKHLNMLNRKRHMYRYAFAIQGVDMHKMRHLKWGEVNYDPYPGRWNDDLR
eukprot:GHVQ01018917.1.p1 GENE.GHVQ01018917.1~~GHVQ01018917.1.p1  ORF type:complete len:416 (+),score=43.57 GHVQ01018917.1:249-1496(+)